MRITSGTNPRLRLFAVAQIAASFVLLAGAGMLLTMLIALQRGLRDAKGPRGERTGDVECAAALLMISAVLASLLPAARASRVDVVQALRSESTAKHPSPG